MEGVDPRLIHVAEHALSISRIDFGIPNLGGYRTAQEQWKLYTEEASQVDGYKIIGNHQRRRALDFFAYVNGKASWEPEHLSMVGAAFLQSAIILDIDVRWGGLWKSFKDMPHTELGPDE
jgi:peptidoglycan L-alanyl-D-glutamate endopeptidase CwlK